MTSIAQTEEKIAGRKAARRGYLPFLIILMGFVAVMDQYLSTVKSSALPFILEEYGFEAAEFSWLESICLSATFLIFLLNGLNDIIGRKLSILVLILIMGFASLGIALFTPSIGLFMLFYTLIMYTTVSNMWSIPVSEEAPAASRAKLVSIVFVIGLIPFQAILPPLIVDRWGLDWKWMFGVMFIFMLPVLIMWLFMHETERFRIIREEREQGVRRKHFYGLGVIDRRDIRFIIFSALIWFCWLVNSLLYYWAGYYFMTVKGYTLSQWSMILLGMLVLAMAGGVTGGWILDRLGRKVGLVIGCFGMMLSLLPLGFVDGMWMNILAMLSGFFSALTYSWIVVYIPEVFPTERRGACMGWTTTSARVSYVAGPALAGVLLSAFPSMDWFWVVAGVIMLVPVGIVFVFKPYETRRKELEEIEADR